MFGLPLDLNRAGGNQQHTALYLGCARALPHSGARTSSARGHQDMILCCHGGVVIMAVTSALYAVPCDLDLGAPSSGDADADVALRQLPLLLFVAHRPPPPPHLPLLLLSHPHHLPPPPIERRVQGRDGN